MTPTVASVAAATPALSTLTAAVGQANLADYLSNSTNTLTVFAPTDEAFAAYLEKVSGVRGRIPRQRKGDAQTQRTRARLSCRRPKTHTRTHTKHTHTHTHTHTQNEQAGITSQALLESPDLGSILKYHIVSGAAVQSGDLKDGQVVETKLGGAPLTIDLSSTPGSVIIKGAESSATVVTPDVPAGNSVVHVVDAVLAPSASEIADAKAKWEAGKAEMDAPRAT
jgi:uncharacterized surface protein with fasciclin (FAS1) repeats